MGINVEDVWEAAELTVYAVEARYPDFEETVAEGEAREHYAWQRLC